MEHARWSPELQLLVAAARPSVSPQTSERIRALAAETIDWSRVLQLAEEHGVRPLLYQSLQTCPEKVPGSFFEQLLGFIRADVAHNLSQNAELVRLIKGLGERGIPAIPFKGGVLAEVAYADPSLRESGDIDIVVRRRHLREAMAFLLTADYRSRGGDVTGKLEGTTDANLGRYHRFDRIDGLASVDLQISLEAPHFSFPLDNDEVWERAVSRPFAGHTVLNYCAEDLLILLCVHGTKDVWFKLKWICDIAGFIDRERNLDWNQVLGRAASLRATRKLYLGCFLAHDLLAADLPGHVLARIQREAAVHHAARTIAEKYSLSSSSRRFTPHERTTLYFRTADPGDKVSRLFRYVWRSLGTLTKVSENDRQFLRLPAWLSPAYYLVRPIRLLTQFGKPRVAAKAIREMFESLD